MITTTTFWNKTYGYLKEKRKEWLPEIKGEGGLSSQSTKDLGDSDSGHCSGYTTVVDMYHMLVLK